MSLHVFLASKCLPTDRTHMILNSVVCIPVVLKTALADRSVVTARVITYKFLPYK